MKYYTRQIKPFIQHKAGSGVYATQYTVDGYDWVSEELEEELRSKIVFNRFYDDLIFKERFVEVQK